MKISNLITDDNAVSPVIGVILMVAITVILAAVIGTFVMDLGQNAGQSGPTAAFDFDEATGNDDTVDITVESTNQKLSNINANGCDGDLFSSESYSAGDTETCTMTEDTIRIVWSAPGSDQTEVLATYEQ